MHDPQLRVRVALATRSCGNVAHNRPERGWSMGKKSFIDELFSSSGNKKGGNGKYWNGGHESTRGGKSSGKTTHYAHDHRSGTKKGWEYDWKTGKSRKF